MCLISWTQKRDPHKLFRGDFWGQKGGPKRAIFSHKKFSLLLFFPALIQNKGLNQKEENQPYCAVKLRKVWVSIKFLSANFGLNPPPPKKRVQNEEKVYIPSLIEVRASCARQSLASTVLLRRTAAAWYYVSGTQSTVARVRLQPVLLS